MDGVRPNGSRTSRLLSRIVLVGALGSGGCGGTVREQPPDDVTPATGGASTGGAPSNTGGAPLSTGGIVGIGGTLGCTPGPSGGAFGAGGSDGWGGLGGSPITADACAEWDDYVCADDSGEHCACDPSQPDYQEDCAPGTYLVSHFPSLRMCMPAVCSPQECEFSAQYRTLYDAETETDVHVCDTQAPLVEGDCINSFLVCSTYDPPTDCRCFIVD